MNNLFVIESVCEDDSSVKFDFETKLNRNIDLLFEDPVDLVDSM